MARLSEEPDDHRDGEPAIILRRSINPKLLTVEAPVTPHQRRMC